MEKLTEKENEMLTVMFELYYVFLDKFKSYYINRNDLYYLCEKVNQAFDIDIDYFY